MEAPQFDFDAHEREVNEWFENEARRKARVRAFDYLVDMALDGQIEIAEAIGQYKTELEAGVVYGNPATA